MARRRGKTHALLTKSDRWKTEEAREPRLFFSVSFFSALAGRVRVLASLLVGVPVHYVYGCGRVC